MSGHGMEPKKTYYVKKTDALWAGYLLVMVPAAYFVSTYLLGFYLYGDQVFYTRFYEGVQGVGLLQVPYHQLATTGSAEPLFGLTIWVASNFGFGKIAFISFANAMLVLAGGLAARRLGAGLFVTTLLFTNYYVLVLLTSAERLKFSYLALALIFLVPGKLKVVTFLLAPLFHFQTLINYAAWLSNRVFQTRLSNFRRGSFQLKAAVYFLIAIIAGNFVFAKYGTSFAEKFAFYLTASSGDFSQLAKVALLLFSGLLMRIRIATLFSYFFPIFVVLFLVGPERVNMIGFIMFFYLVAQQKKLHHPAFIAIMVYLSFKSIEYVNNIITFGTGYPA